MTKEKKYNTSKYNIPIKDNGKYILYNSFSGALSVFDEEDMKLLNALEKNEIDELTQQQHIFRDKVLINNFLVPADVNETEVLEQKYRGRKDEVETMTLTILPTLNCNFACNYCFEGSHGREEVMSQEIQDKWLNWFQDNLKGIKQVYVTWFGGEPTLGIKVIRHMSDRMIAICDQRNIKYQASIITNGSLLNLDMVGELYVRRIFTFQVTLDGPSHVHDKIRFDRKTGEGSFHKIINNLKEYSQVYPVHTSVRINVDSRNESLCFELLDEIYPILKDCTNVNVYFAPIHASTTLCSHISLYTLESTHYAELETKLSTYASERNLMHIGLPPMYMGICGAAKPNGWVIVPNGDIHKCWETVSMPEYRIGNIMNEAIISEEAIQKWRTWSPFNEEECKECRIMPNCVGMCTYRFLYGENYSGNSALSPCPSLKYEIENRILAYVHKYYPELNQ